MITLPFSAGLGLTWSPLALIALVHGVEQCECSIGWAELSHTDMASSILL